MCTVSSGGTNGGGERGQMPLSATGKGRKTPSQKYFVTSEQKVTTIKHDD